MITEIDFLKSKEFIFDWGSFSELGLYYLRLILYWDSRTGFIRTKSHRVHILFWVIYLRFCLTIGPT